MGAGWAMSACNTWFRRVGNPDQRAAWLLDRCCCAMDRRWRLAGGPRCGLAWLFDRCCWASNANRRGSSARLAWRRACGARLSLAWARLDARLIDGRLACAWGGCARTIDGCRARGSMGWRYRTIRASCEAWRDRTIGMGWQLRIDPFSCQKHGSIDDHIVRLIVDRRAVWRRIVAYGCCIGLKDLVKARWIDDVAALEDQAKGFS